MKDMTVNEWLAAEGIVPTQPRTGRAVRVRTRHPKSLKGRAYFVLTDRAKREIKKWNRGRPASG